MKYRYLLAFVCLVLLPILISSCMWPFGTSTTGSVPTINSFAASAASVSPGGSATLSWNVSNATTVIIDNGIGTVGVTGATAVTPAVTTTYTLTAVGTGGAANQSVTVAVVGGAATTTPAGGLPFIQFSVNPTAITPRGTAVLTWNVTGATTVVIDNGIGPVPLSGSRAVSPDVSRTYVLTATNPNGSNTSAVALAVAPAGSPGPGPAGDKDWLGSTYTREYHYPSCTIARNITPPHKIWFETWQQAKAAGYRPCSVCRPPF
jgi:hypothetical protein